MEAAMALKDLIAEKAALDEAAIERIVTPYVRYDVETQQVTFTPAFAGLSNRAKILVYLIALQGWRFVADNAPAADARPADVEDATGIPGGSLRPTLRLLCENHIVSDKDGRYSARAASFPAIEAELSGSNNAPILRRARPVSRAARTSHAEAEITAEVEEVPPLDGGDSGTNEGLTEKAPRKISGKSGNLAATFDRWIGDGYFDQPRTLAEVLKRFRKEAIMVPRTSLPGYFLSAVRNGRLTRDEIQANGKTVWAYSTNKGV